MILAILMAMSLDSCVVRWGQIEDNPQTKTQSIFVSLFGTGLAEAEAPVEIVDSKTRIVVENCENMGTHEDFTGSSVSDLFFRQMDNGGTCWNLYASEGELWFLGVTDEPWGQAREETVKGSVELNGQVFYIPIRHESWE